MLKKFSSMKIVIVSLFLLVIAGNAWSAKGSRASFPKPDPAVCLNSFGKSMACPDSSRVGGINLVGPAISEYSIPTANSQPYGITPGPNDTLWFTELAGNNIGRYTPTGISSGIIFDMTAVTEFSIPTSSSDPGYIVMGPDGNLWFTEYSGDKVGKITTTGVITEYALSTGANPIGITVGPDNNLWFCEDGANKIAKMSTAGALLNEYDVPTAASSLTEIVSGRDGNLWFTEYDGKKVGKITTSGTITEYDVGRKVFGIAAGEDGNLWFTETNADLVGRITPSGTITEFDLPGENNGPQGITAGPFGHLFITGNFSNKIFRMTILGDVIAEYDIPTVASGPLGITEASDGNLWFVEMNGNQVGTLTPTGAWNFLPAIMR